MIRSLKRDLIVSDRKIWKYLEDEKRIVTDSKVYGLFYENNVVIGCWFILLSVLARASGHASLSHEAFLSWAEGVLFRAPDARYCGKPLVKLFIFIYVHPINGRINIYYAGGPAVSDIRTPKRRKYEQMASWLRWFIIVRTTYRNHRWLYVQYSLY